MAHFAEARRAVERYFREDATIRARISRVCLLWDLRGRLQIIVKPLVAKPSTPPDTALQADIKAAIAPLAGPFFTNEVWIWAEPGSSKAEMAVYETAMKLAIELDSGPPEMRMLDRHTSKELWLAIDKVQPVWPANPRTPPILTFFSFKGGVGRTTALLSFATQLARANKRVAIVDLDLEAPGLLSALPPANGVGPACGVVDYLLERPLVDSKNPLDLSDFYYTVDDSRVIGGGAPITVIPAGKIDEFYLEKLARLDFGHLQMSTRAPMDAMEVIRDLLTRLKAEYRADYILLDSRAGFHDIGGLVLSNRSHLSLLFGLDSEQSWEGMTSVVRHLGSEQIKRGQEQLACALVYAMAPAQEPERTEKRAHFLEKAYEVFASCYYDPPGQGGWPLPELDVEEEPHYPLVLAHKANVQGYNQLGDIADELVSGDFKLFFTNVLQRLGRPQP